jgi:UDP-hydrolysing UDP-N-acetyl-D-glucosamine 2-epimerase
VRRVAVFTATRAEYGLLTPLLEELRDASDLDLRLIASGSHLSPEFGFTRRLIEDDGFRVDAEVEMLLSSDSAVGAAKSAALALMGVAECLDRLAPDLLIVLGDRYEVLAAAHAALLANVPVAHIGGGEVTEGAVDESIRHAVTKLAHLHFVASPAFARRVVQLGEEPALVFPVGALGLDSIRRLRLLDRDELEAELGWPLRRPLLVVTQHPTTARPDRTEAGTTGLLSALDAFPDATVLFTQSNADVTARRLNAAIRDYAAGRDSASVVGTLGRHRYLSAIAVADAVVGNSSSGLIEAPAVGTPTVDIGDRQRGRPRAASVVHCGDAAAEISSAIGLALSGAVQDIAARRQSPYGDGRAAERICAVLSSVSLPDLVTKSFVDQPVAGRAGWIGGGP